MSTDVMTQFPTLIYEPELSSMKQRRMAISVGRRTLTRAKIIEYIISYKVSHDGNSPTSREIADATDCSSTSVVHYHLRVLERQRKIKVVRHSSRQIEVVGGRWIPPKG